MTHTRKTLQAFRDLMIDASAWEVGAAVLTVALVTAAALLAALRLSAMALRKIRRKRDP